MFGFAAAMSVASVLTYYAELPTSWDASAYRLPRAIYEAAEQAVEQVREKDPTVRNGFARPRSRPLYFDAPPTTVPSILRWAVFPKASMVGRITLGCGVRQF